LGESSAEMIVDSGWRGVEFMKRGSCGWKREPEWEEMKR
jgi:hypothetical protein